MIKINEQERFSKRKALTRTHDQKKFKINKIECLEMSTEIDHIHSSDLKKPLKLSYSFFSARYFIGGVSIRGE